MGAFGCLFGGVILLFFFVLAFGLLLIQKVLSIFGIHLPIEKFISMRMGQPFPHGSNGPFQDQSQNQSQGQNQSTPSSVTNKKPVYGDDEGEYVEFEEIKD